MKGPPKPRHYVFVVHGIGEQKLNETTFEVVHRFAEVRQNKKAEFYKNLLPSYLSAQSVRRDGMGHGWSEFNGIPVDPARKTGAFDGTPATDTSGENFRFVDLYWAHILQGHQQAYASPVDQWTDALLERIDEETGIVPPRWIPAWATDMLHALVNTAVPIYKLLSLRYPEQAKRYFADFLGDVHLYGDYARTRGRAVRHFHVVLDEIFLRDFIDWCHRDRDHQRKTAYQPPVFTVIAHSLGSIMSFDALVYAHAKETLRQERAASAHPCPSLPFPGYTFDKEIEKNSWQHLITKLKETKRADELTALCPQLSDDPPKIPYLLWRGQVRSFITLGAPIDKYHVIWFQNYLHMGLKNPRDKQGLGGGRIPKFDAWCQDAETKRSDDWLQPPSKKIVHYNLCDEQDPVGHHLEVAHASDNYGKIFDTSIPVAYRDVVFRRYAVPGLAHVKYWKDGKLFQGIIREVIEGGSFPPDELELTDHEKQNNMKAGYFLTAAFRDKDKRVYRRALVWAYFRIPFVAALVTGVLLSYGFYGLLDGGLASWKLEPMRALAILAALFLWTRPMPGKVYAKEADPRGVEQAERTKAWKFRRSVFANLVAGAVEWRRILIMLSKGKATDRETAVKDGTRMAFATKGGFYVRFWWRVLAALALAGGLIWFLLFNPVSASIGKPIRIGTEMLLFVTGSYIATMFYVRHVFAKAKKREKSEAG